MKEDFALEYARIWTAELRRRRPATLRDLAEALGREELNRRIRDAAVVAVGARMMDLGPEIDAACDLLAADVHEVNP